MRTERVSTLVPNLFLYRSDTVQSFISQSGLAKKSPARMRHSPAPYGSSAVTRRPSARILSVAVSKVPAPNQVARRVAVARESGSRPASRDEVVLLGLYSASSHEREREDQDQVDPDGHGEGEFHARG